MAKYTYITPEKELKLIEDYLNGNSSAYAPLFRKYKMIFFTNIYKWYKNDYKNPNEVDDMAVEFLGRISSKLHKYDPEKSKFSTWMMHAMKNYMKEYWAKKNRKKRKGIVEDIDNHHSIPDPTPNPIGELERASYRKLIKRMLESLGPEDTKIFNEVIVKGESQSATAKLLGIKTSTFQYRYQRLLKRLEKFRPENF